MGNNNELDIIINAKDKTKEAFSSAEKNTRGLVDRIDDMKPTFQRMAAAGTVAFGAIAGVIYKSVQAAGESEQVLAQMAAVLKSTGNAAGLFTEDLTKQAQALQKLTTYGDEAIMSAQNLLLTFTNVKGGVFKESINTILDMSTALGTDLKSSSILVGKALNDPINGISALTRVGVTFTEKQKEQIKTMAESGNVMEAQRLILKELNTEFGGSAAAAADTFKGRMEQVKNQIGEVGEAIGNSFIPRLKELGERLLPIVEKIVDWINKNPELASRILIISGAVAGFTALVGILGLVLPTLAAGFSIVLGPVGLLIAAFALIITNMGWIKEKIEAVKSVLEDLGVIQYFKDIWAELSEIFQNILLPALKRLWDTLVELKPVFEFLAKVIGAVVLVAIMALAEGLKIVFAIFSSIFDIMSRIAKFIVDVFMGAINGIKSLFTSLGETLRTVADFFENLWQKVSKFGGQVTNAVGNAVNSVFGGQKVNDAVISPEGRVISTHPDDYLIATKNPSSLGGGGMVVNINGGNYLSEMAAKMLGDELIASLKMQIKL